MKNIRIIAPSRSLKMLSQTSITLATLKLNELGYNVSFSKNAFIADEVMSSSIIDRVEDITEAFKDDEVDIVLAAVGGYNANQLLDYIDYDLIKSNPKIICGHSDITVLINAVYRKTGTMAFLGPNFHDFAMEKGLENTIESFNSAVKGKAYDLIDPKFYSDDKWYNNQQARKFIKNDGMISINNGRARGTIVGGNLCSFNLLQGTKYMPDLRDKILFLEDDDLVGDAFPLEFDRNLQSLVHQKYFDRVRGIVFGRSQVSTNMDNNKWQKIIQNKRELERIPVVINANFGHTTPTSTIPIGGHCFIEAEKNKVKIKVWR